MNPLCVVVTGLALIFSSSCSANRVVRQAGKEGAGDAPIPSSVTTGCGGAALSHGFRLFEACGFDASSLMALNSVNSSNDGQAFMNSLLPRYCACNSDCRSVMRDFYSACGLQKYSDQIISSLDQQCAGGSTNCQSQFAIIQQKLTPCISQLYNCPNNDSDMCRAEFEDLVHEHGCCVNELFRFSSNAGNISLPNFFELCSVADPGACPNAIGKPTVTVTSTTTSSLPCPTSSLYNSNVIESTTTPMDSVCTVTDIVTATVSSCPSPTSEVPSASPIATDSISPTTSTPIIASTSPPLKPSGPKCDAAVTRFLKNRACSAGVDIIQLQVLALQNGQPLPHCELQRILDRLCKSQKCLNALLIALNVCLEEKNLSEQQRDEIISNHVAPQFVNLYCVIERKSKDYCGILFPELQGDEVLNALKCGLEDTCSEECNQAVQDAKKKYRCCLGSYLQLKATVGQLSSGDYVSIFNKCKVRRPQECRQKLRLDAISLD